jgi:putative addiction module component (TIGR02574 family)
MRTVPEPAGTMASLLRLPKKRKMEIAERLWLSAIDERTTPVPAAHKKTVTTRLADYRSGKSVPVPHAELMRKLRAK